MTFDCLEHSLSGSLGQSHRNSRLIYVPPDLVNHLQHRFSLSPVTSLLLTAQPLVEFQIQYVLDLDKVRH